MPEQTAPAKTATVSPAFIVGLIQLLLKEAPGAVSAVRTLLNVKEPTDADFEAAKEQIRKDTFESLVPNAEKFPKA